MSARQIPVVILQYGKFELTEKCIESVRAQTVPTRVIFIDGNSPGKTASALEKMKKLSDESYILEENLGYAGANNVAIRGILEAGDEYCFVLNNDTLLAPDCLKTLVQFLDEHQNVGQVCPTVCYPDGTLQAAGATIRKDIFEPQLTGHQASPSDYQVAMKTEYAPGMAVLVRMEAVRKAGLIPEEYFMYAEDVDWSLQIQKAGWEIWYCPTPPVTHYDSASTGTFHFKKGYYMVRANVMLAKKWLSSGEYRTFGKKFLQKLIRQSVKYIAHPAYVRGMWAGYREGKQK